LAAVGAAAVIAGLPFAYPNRVPVPSGGAAFGAGAGHVPGAAASSAAPVVAAVVLGGEVAGAACAADFVGGRWESGSAGQGFR